ncbi:DsrE family protein [Myroides sp. LJL119]
MNTDTKHKVVFQFNSDSVIEQNALLTYVNNVKKHWDKDVTIHVVVHGPGIGMVQKSKTMVAEPLRIAMGKGIKFFACNNTLLARKVDKEDIEEDVSFVSSGLVEIIEKQEQGWSYIKCNL